ncbi:acyl carrier protein [Sinorhizobium fredii]|uniref:Acyl carrier protein n=1 Tax=Rhizobium fredii TaxID=380 RepID=A0A2A6M734_RHIFR|nr:acyl carrier protein [Sinorhizobium fredii]PDT50465.1 acyl carrier protein [Sinorhizobium fredii]
MESPSAPIADRVKEIIIEQLGIEASLVVDEASIVDDLGADSLEIAQLVMLIEEEFGIDISDNAADALVTVGDAIYFVIASKAKT